MSIEIPNGWKYCVALLAAGALYGLGMLHGERMEGQVHLDYLAAQSQRTVAIAKAQEKVVVRTEIEYLDRIQKIYVKGDVIEKQVPVYVTRGDDAACTVNAGFVRAYNAAWAGDDTGPSGESDRESSGVPLSEVAENDAFNATACRAWREQALTLKGMYLQIKRAIDTAAR